MGTPEVTNLLKIVNNDLSIVRSRFDALSRDVISLELQKQNSMNVLQELNDQITASRERVEYKSYVLRRNNGRNGSVVSKKGEIRGIDKTY